MTTSIITNFNDSSLPLNEFGCNNSKRVDVYFKGIQNDIPATLNFPNPSNIEEVFIEIIYKKKNPGPSISVTDNDGNSYSGNRILINGDDDKWIYRISIPTNISSVIYSNTTYEGKAQSMVAYVYRVNVANPHYSIDFFANQVLHHSSISYDFEIPAGSAPRDINLKIPVSDLSFDDRELVVSASIGNVSNTVTKAWGPNSNPFPDGCCVDIIEVNLPQVPGEETELILTATSPQQNGQSFVLSGTINLAVECSCPFFEIQTLSNQSDFCSNQEVVFFTESNDNIDEGDYSWSFGEGANPLTALGLGPHQVNYNISGQKMIELEISNETCNEVVETNIEIIENFTTPGTIQGNETNCSSYNPTIINNQSLPQGGDGGNITYKWQKREDPENNGNFSSWVGIPSSNTPFYNPSIINVTTQFRRRARRLPCTQWQNSNIITKAITECSEICDNNIDDDGDGLIDEADPACAEIGDFVWEDRNSNGRQNLNDEGISGIIVSLYDENCTLIALDTTDYNGKYYFNKQKLVDYSGVAESEFEFNKNYYIVVADAVNGSFDSQTNKLTHNGQVYQLTNSNIGNNDAIDSDAIIEDNNLCIEYEGFPVIPAVISSNTPIDYSYDIGFFLDCSLEIISTNISYCSLPGISYYDLNVSYVDVPEGSNLIVRFNGNTVFNAVPIGNNMSFSMETASLTNNTMDILTVFFSGYQACRDEIIIEPPSDCWINIEIKDIFYAITYGRTDRS